ncbi:MAG: endopeptidase La [Acidobacteria bacterium]|nr:endopeptidase La [Acidobacteriota bacterium]
MVTKKEKRDRSLKEWLETEVPSRLPALPLISTVLFPGGVVSLTVAIPRNVELIRSLSEEPAFIAVFPQKTGDREEPTAEDLSRIGVLATVVQKLPLAEDRYQVFLQGRQRIERVEVTRTEPHFEVELRDVPPLKSHLAEAKNLMERSMLLFARLAETDSRYNQELLEVLQSNMAEGPDLYADLLATLVPELPLEFRQELLEAVNPADRIQRLLARMEEDYAHAQTDQELQKKVNLSFRRHERESYLREQMKAIQAELGETSVAEADEYARKIENLGLPEESEDSLLREVARLRILSPASSDYAVIRGHLDLVMEMPWGNSTPTGIDLEEAGTILDARHHSIEEVKDRVLEYLAVLKLTSEIRGPVLCFAGPPGVGKTSLGQAIADAMGRKFVRFSVGGMTDESEIRGHRKTYIGAMPGKIVQSYIQVGVNNPLIMIDEIDKIGKDFRGDPAAALLEVLDPEQNHAFLDRYLEIPFDLSRTVFIATANHVASIPGPLKDRMEIIQLPGYTPMEKLVIAREHLLPRLLKDHGLEAERVTFDEGTVVNIISEYTAEAGVRHLERQLAAVIRKIARKVATDQKPDFTVDMADIAEYLGPPKYEHEFAGREPEIGVTTGLAWTSYGGEIMFIEATMMPGSGRIIVTGHLGEVMRESVQAAHSYVRSKADELEIHPSRFQDFDFHVHFPAGAIPKDGPSAGVAVATTIVSVAGEKPVRHDVAMTGEITLRGKVLSVGGIREKVLAAHRAKLKTVILAEGNRKDLHEVPLEVQTDLEFVFVERVEQVWEKALIPLYLVKDRGRRFDMEEFRADIPEKGPR